MNSRKAPSHPDEKNCHLNFIFDRTPIFFETHFLRKSVWPKNVKWRRWNESKCQMGKENVTLNLELCFSESSHHQGIVLSLGIDQKSLVDGETELTESMLSGSQLRLYWRALIRLTFHTAGRVNGLALDASGSSKSLHIGKLKTWIHEAAKISTLIVLAFLRTDLRW